MNKTGQLGAGPAWAMWPPAPLPPAASPHGAGAISQQIEQQSAQQLRTQGATTQEFFSSNQSANNCLSTIGKEGKPLSLFSAILLPIFPLNCCPFFLLGEKFSMMFPLGSLSAIFIPLFLGRRRVELGDSLLLDPVEQRPKTKKKQF